MAYLCCVKVAVYLVWMDPIISSHNLLNKKMVGKIEKKKKKKTFLFLFFYFIFIYYLFFNKMDGKLFVASGRGGKYVAIINIYFIIHIIYLFIHLLYLFCLDLDGVKDALNKGANINYKDVYGVQYYLFHLFCVIIS